MTTRVRLLAMILLPLAGAWLAAQQPAPSATVVPPVAGETHLANIRQLTFGGENAEAYFSFDGKRLAFQSMRDGSACDQIYTMNIDGSDVRRISNGEGRTTCSFYEPDGRHLVYASTHLGGKDCPPKPDFSRGYVWPVYAWYDIFRANADGSNLAAAHDLARLRRRGHDRPRWPHRVHQRPRR